MSCSRSLFAAIVVWVSMLLAGRSSFAADVPLVATSVSQVDRDYWFQGEYLGSARNSCGKCQATGLQVVALGKNEFQAVLFSGGLPGGGWWSGMELREFKGSRDGDVLRLIGDSQRIEIQKSKATIQAVYQPPTPASEPVSPATCGATAEVVPV